MTSPSLLRSALVLPTTLFLGMSTLSGCTGGGGSERVEVVREELPGGGLLLRYASLPDAPHHSLEPDLVVGVLEGDPAYLFGDIRGLDVGPEGEIFVLDYQARHIRVFSREGEHLRTLAGPGDGPGEIRRANGILLDDEGTLWVNDHGRMHYLGLDPVTGEERARIPFADLSFAYLWDRARDLEGRFFQSAARPLSTPGSSGDAGPVESRSVAWLKWVDPASNTTDSISLGEITTRAYRFVTQGGGGMMGIPFAPSARRVVRPAGGFWHTDGQGYRLHRSTLDGDTALVIEVGMSPRPVTAQDRARLLEERGTGDSPIAQAFRDAIAFAPDHHPLLDQLVVDDADRLWVRRVRPESDLPLYDVFHPDGEYLLSVELSFPASEWWPPVIRRGTLLLPFPDEMEVPRIARIPLPQPLRR